MLRLRLLAAVPLCALVGCATVKAREVAPQVAPVAAVAPGGMETPHSEAGQAGVAEVAVSEAEQAEPLPEARPVVAGVIAAALQAAAQVTGPASTSGRFWDTLLAQTELEKLIVKRSTQLVGSRKLSGGVPNDCSGFVRLAYLAAGIDLVNHGFLAGENAVSAIFRRALDVGTVHHQAPRPGDLVFFRETYDRNRDGRRNDGMTHIGVVEAVDADGTVTFIHRGGKGVARGRLNLSAPSKHQLGQGGPVINDYIRPATKSTRSYLAGELFAAFASPEGL